MIYLFCDTSVLLNLATDIKLYDVVENISELVNQSEVQLVLCDIIIHELQTHEDKIVSKRIDSYRSHLKNTKNIYDFLSEETLQALKADIEKAHANLDKMDAVLKRNLDEVLKLVGKSILITNTQQNKKNVIQRAIDKKFPFHRNKNSVKDALISEAFEEFINDSPADMEGLYFITDNVSDFSDVNNKNLPHPDWAELFIEDLIFYSINIASVINSIHPNSIEQEIEDEIQERSTAICIDGNHHKFDSTAGFWQNSKYGGGLSWHYRCEKCGITYDTGEYWD